MLNIRVLCRSASRKEGIPWWYEYSINPIKGVSQDITDAFFIKEVFYLYVLKFDVIVTPYESCLEGDE
jgi:hypothetical protein